MKTLSKHCKLKCITKQIGVYLWKITINQFFGHQKI